MKKSYLLFLLLTIICLLSSCDYEHTKDYTVKNDLDSAITFKFTAKGIRDSVEIKNGEEKVIFIYSYVFGTVGVNDDRDNDPVLDFNIEFDTLFKTIDEDSWLYKESGKYHANYLLKVDSNLIK